MSMAKISIRSNEFIQPIAKALDHGKELVIWHQIPWSGGAQEWYLIRSIEALDKVLNKGCVASAFTAYEWLELPLPHQVDQVWLTCALDILVATPNNDAFLLSPVNPDNALLHLKLLIEEDEIKEWFETHMGTEALAGHVSDLFTGEIVRGYFPDANGIPQSGPY